MGWPEVTIGPCRLICGDALEVVPTLGQVDAVVTDPPYGIGFKYASHEDTSKEYGAWLWAILEQAEKRCTPGAPLFIFQAMLNVTHFSTWFPRNWRLFAAAKNFVQMRRTTMQYAYDPVVCWWIEGSQWSSPARQGAINRDFFVANSAYAVTQTQALQRQHPCPRPLDQMCMLVENWVQPLALVLDPFMGSGTTGVACVQLGRAFIGVEIDPGYFDLACDRIEQAYAQMPLFPAAQPLPAKQEQLALFGDRA